MLWLKCMVFLNLIKWTGPFPFYVLLYAIFHFYSNFNRKFCKQTMETLISCCILQRLIWVYTVCLCPTKKMLGLYGLRVSSKVKPVYNGHSQKDKKLVFKTKYCLMQVKSIAECSKGSILQYFRPSLSKIFVLSFFEWQVLLLIHYTLNYCP